MAVLFFEGTGGGFPLLIINLFIERMAVLIRSGVMQQVPRGLQALSPDHMHNVHHTYTTQN
jgi:hypothetical protein